MRGNGGYIGPLNVTSTSSVNGVYDRFDNFNAEKDGNWQKPVEVSGFTSYSTTWYENTSRSFTVNFENLLSDETFYINYVFTAGSGEGVDLSFSPNSFSALASTGSGSFSVATNFIGDLIKTDTLFAIEIRRGSISGDLLYTSSIFTIPPVILAASTSFPSSVSEGNFLQINFQLSNVGSYSSQLFDLSTSGTAISGTDYAAFPTSFSINPGIEVYTVSREIYADFTTEGTETLEITISYNGNLLYAPSSSSIFDTSTDPVIAISPSSSSVTEGETVTFLVTDANGSQVGTLYYSLNGIQAADVDSLTGSFEMSAGGGSFDVTLIADGVAEGESFTATVRRDSPTGPALSTSSSVSIVDAAAPLGEDITSAFYSIAEFVNNDGASDTTTNYSVSQVQQDYTGTGRLYLIHKAAGSGESSFYYDAPVACIQVLNSAGTVVNQQWWFGVSGDPVGWETHTQEYDFGGLGTGVNITPSDAASNYSYTLIVNGATADRFNLATSTGSSSTGAVGGIPQPSAPMTLGEQTMLQIDSAYYMYREMSGGTNNFCALCRSPSRTWTGGEIIRIAYIIGNRTSATAYQADDTFFVGIA